MAGTFTVAHDGDDGEVTTTFVLPGTVSVVRGSAEVLTSDDLTWFLNRGDKVRIGTSLAASAEYIVSTNVAHTFDATTMTLSTNYAADTMVGIAAWRKPVTTTLPIAATATEMKEALYWRQISKFSCSYSIQLQNLY